MPLLQEYQHKEIFTYEMKDQCYVLEVKRLRKNIPELANELLKIQRILEKQAVEKIDCMYFAARSLSLPCIDAYIKELNSEDPSKADHTNQMN